MRCRRVRASISPRVPRNVSLIAFLVGRVTACPEQVERVRAVPMIPSACTPRRASSGLPALPEHIFYLIERVTLPTHCHVERSKTSLVYFCCGSAPNLIRDSSLWLRMSTGDGEQQSFAAN